MISATVEELVAEAVLYRLDTPELAAAIEGPAGRRTSAALSESITADTAQLDELAALYAARRITAPEWMTARSPSRPVSPRTDAGRPTRPVPPSLPATSATAAFFASSGRVDPRPTGRDRPSPDRPRHHRPGNARSPQHRTGPRRYPLGPLAGGPRTPGAGAPSPCIRRPPPPLPAGTATTRSAIKARYPERLRRTQSPTPQTPPAQPFHRTHTAGGPCQSRRTWAFSPTRSTRPSHRPPRKATTTSQTRSGEPATTTSQLLPRVNVNHQEETPPTKPGSHQTLATKTAERPDAHHTNTHEPQETLRLCHLGVGYS